MMNGPSMGPTGDSSMYGGGGVDPGMYGGSVPASGYGSYTDDYTADPMRSGGGSASAGQTSPWTSAMQQRFSAGGPYTQSQQQMPPSSGMSGHYGNMYNRMNMQQRMSPQRPQDKPFFNTPHKQVSEQKLNAFLFRVPEATQGGGAASVLGYFRHSSPILPEGNGESTSRCNTKSNQKGVFPTWKQQMFRSSPCLVVDLSRT